MATHTRAEPPVIFDCNLGEDGLAEFEPEAQRGALWLRVDSPAAVDMQRWATQVVRPRTRGWPLAAPVVIAAVIAGGAVFWLQISARPGELPSPPPPSVSGEVSPGEVPSSEALSREAALAVAVPSAPPAVPDRPAAAAAQPDAPALDPAFERTLASVSASYRALDAASLTAVWPGADTAALSRAFGNLKYQSLSFDRCAVRPNGPTGAVATCEVSRAMAPNAGDPSLERRHESWTLILDRSAGERWTITGASVR
jgi:hypothetical protein